MTKLKSFGKSDSQLRKMSSSDWPVGKFVKALSISDGYGRAQWTVGGATPGAGGLIQGLYEKAGQ